MRILTVLILMLLSHAAIAACPKHDFTDSKKIRFTGDSVLIVTHATSFHDARVATKRGVDEAVNFAKGKRIPVVYLQDDGPAQFYFMEDCNPDYWVYSEGGEIGFEVTPSHVYIAGGHLELCMSGTLHDVLYSWAKQGKRNVTVTYLMDAIYSNGKSIDESDAFYSDYEKFMRVITYRRPGGEHWPKLTLLETLGTIRQEEHELEYLTKILPHYESTLPANYRVELALNDSVTKVLRPAAGWKPPTIRFEFVDSAVNLSSGVGN